MNPARSKLSLIGTVGLAAAATQGRRCCQDALLGRNAGPALLLPQQLRDDVVAEIGAQQQRWDYVAGSSRST